MKNQLVIFYLVLAFFVAIFFSGCSHNPAVFTVGKRTNIGFDPAAMSANISWTDGLNIIDVTRENSQFHIEIDESTGLQFDPVTNSLKGIKKISRKTGVQVTGYLVDLAKVNPELAALYLQHYFEAEKADAAINALQAELEVRMAEARQAEAIRPAESD